MDRYKKAKSLPDTIDEIKKTFSSVYLTLISIIQASLLGYFLFTFGGYFSDFTVVQWIVTFTTFLMIVTTWNEYMMGSMVFSWIPRLRDSLLPFSIGITELFVIRFITDEIYKWYIAITAFCFVGLLAFKNMYDNARRYPENNNPVLNSLDNWPKITLWWVFGLVLTFGLFSIISIFLDCEITQYVLSSLSALLFASFLFIGRVKYWHRIVGPYIGPK